MDSLDTVAGVQLRCAGVLDIPFIFSLMTDATINDGAFAERLVSAPGYLSLFISLVASLSMLRRWQRRKGIEHDLLIMEAVDEPVGFIHCIHGQNRDGKHVVHIERCAIHPAHRQKGYGTKMIAWVIARECANEAFITAYCNRYARAMQHIFKRRHFRRRSAGNGLEYYLLEVKPNGNAVTEARDPPAHAE